jgi:GT2 family glycosyltransferase
MTQPLVSIVVPTCNRINRLKRCIEKLRENVSVPREIVVVAAPNADGTTEWLHQQSDLVTILEHEREGAVKAFNKGFRRATGQFVSWLNDDAYPLPGAVEAAIDMIERSDCQDVGMVAFYHNWHQERNLLDCVEHKGERYEVYAVRGLPYANFGLLRRSLLNEIDFADERFYFFAFDPDLSLKIQIQCGLLVLGCRQSLIHHDEDHDERKIGDLAQGRIDNNRLFEKWRLPEKDSYADPAPRYINTLRARGLYDCPFQVPIPCTVPNHSSPM